jgi:hypothetical protein
LCEKRRGVGNDRKKIGLIPNQKLLVSMSRVTFASPHTSITALLSVYVCVKSVRAISSAWKGGGPSGKQRPRTDRLRAATLIRAETDHV